jgi:hypothetical protein
LVQHAKINGNRLNGNDNGIGLYNYDTNCAKSAPTPTSDTACFNVIENSHGYPSADANVTGWSSSPAVGYQAGVTDVGNHDIVCLNAVSGAGYAPRDASSSLPNPPAPAFVRPSTWSPARRSGRASSATPSTGGRTSRPDPAIS